MSEETNPENYPIDIQGLGMVFTTNWGGKKRALDSLNLQIQKNEIFGFLGHNGAGKTTTIKILVGLCYATQGSANIFGVPIEDASARKNIGYLPENVSFYEYLSGFETLQMQAKLHGISKKESKPRSEKLLEEVGLKDAIHRRVREYSKGMRQRLGLAQALIHEPNLLILDEPLTGLDPSGRKEVREKIRELRDKGKTIFFSSHVLADVEMICDRVALMSQGKMIALGDLDSLLNRKVIDIEVVGEGFSEESLKKVQTLASRVKTLNNTTIVSVKTEEEAHQIKAMLDEDGGKLKAFIPHRETLEDFYFRHDQEQKGAQ